MPQTTTVNVRVDENVKRNVEALFNSMGMNISTAVNMFFRQCLTDEAIPFQPRAKRDIHTRVVYEGMGQQGYTRPDLITGVIPSDPLIPKMPREEVFGCMRGKITMSDDFDEPLED